MSFASRTSSTHILPLVRATTVSCPGSIPEDPKKEAEEHSFPIITNAAATCVLSSSGFRTRVFWECDDSYSSLLVS